MKEFSNEELMKLPPVIQEAYKFYQDNSLRYFAVDENAPLEEHFMSSWDHMFYFFSCFLKRPHPQNFQLMIDLIKEFRERGYDKKFRAGQAVSTLILSRSKDYGMREGQHSISIYLTPENTFQINYNKVIYYKNGSPSLLTEKPFESEKFLEMLNRLEKEEIN